MTTEKNDELDKIIKYRKDHQDVLVVNIITIGVIGQIQIISAMLNVQEYSF